MARPCATARRVPCHGGYTLQLINGALLAERTGIVVVGDFRAATLPPAARARRWSAFHAAASAAPA